MLKSVIHHDNQNLIIRDLLIFKKLKNIDLLIGQHITPNGNVSQVRLTY